MRGLGAVGTVAPALPLGLANFGYAPTVITPCFLLPPKHPKIDANHGFSSFGENRASKSNNERQQSRLSARQEANPVVHHRLRHGNAYT